MPDQTPKASWPGWETVRVIGRGSFGTVYEIQREIFGEIEKAALKVISIPQNEHDIDEMHNDGYDEESITETLQTHLKSIVSEYSLMRKMNGCANVVNCDDVRYIKHEDGLGWDIFIKMELLTPLTKALSGDVREEEVVKIARDLCTALVLCKKYEIVHRDIKPQNIFVSPNGDYKLGDFGIAKTVEKTTGGTRIGTYRYIAPEVYHNWPYGSAADIYSLGLVLYWLLNERRMPFVPLPPAKLSATSDEKAHQLRLSGSPLPAPAHGSKELKRIVLKACAYNTRDRYSSAAEMLEDLNKLSLYGYGLQDAPVIPLARESTEIPLRVAEEKTEVQPRSDETEQTQITRTMLLDRDDTQTTLPEQERTQPLPRMEHAAHAAGTGVAVKSAPGKGRSPLPVILIAVVLVIAAVVLFVVPRVSDFAQTNPPQLNDPDSGGEPAQSDVHQTQPEETTAMITETAEPTPYQGEGELQRLYIRTTYDLEETLNAENLELLAVYSDGTRETVMEDFTVTPESFDKAGTHTVTVSYGGLTESFQVEVLDFYEISIELENNTGEGYNETGAVKWVLYVTARYYGNYTQPAFRNNLGLMKEFSGDWSEHWNLAKEGSGCSWRYRCTDSGFDEYHAGGAFCLPDDPNFAGQYTAAVMFGDLEKEVTFELFYDSDYETGTGWELKNVHWN